LRTSGSPGPTDGANVSIRIDRDEWPVGSAKNYIDRVAVFLWKMKENGGTINYFKGRAHNKTILKIFRHSPDEQ
jgi:hypothetical protein